MAVQLPITLPPLPMPHNRAKTPCDLLAGAGFFPIHQQRIDLGHVAIRCAAGVAMEAEAGERRIESIHRSVAEEFPPQMEVGSKFASVWDAGADLFPETSAPEDGFLLDEVGIFWPSMHSGIEAAASETGHFLETFKAAILIHTELAQGGDPLHFREFLKDFPHGGEGPGAIEVGGIKPTHDLAGGLIEAFIDGGVLPAVLLTAPVGKAMRVTLQNLPTAIGGAAVDHHILQLGAAAIRRKKHALNRLLQMRSLVIGWRDDGNFHEDLDKINRISKCKGRHFNHQSH